MRRSIVLLACAVALVAGSCRGDSGDRDEAASSSSSSSSSSTTAAPAESSSSSTGPSSSSSSAPGSSSSSSRGTPPSGPSATTATTRRTTTTTAAPPGTTGTVPVADTCAVGPQAPPTRTLDADNATALAFAPDGRLFFAERSGTVRVFQNGAVREFAKVPTSTSGERGLLGLAISPTFATDRFVYAFVSHPNNSNQDVVRWTDCAGTSAALTTVIRLPAGSTCCHKGGRIKFGPDGKLYVTLGDMHTPAAAQNTNDLKGKVLRYNPDGSVPADNPFGAGSPVWAYGFRNPFGLAISPSGQVAVTSNGPSGDSGSPPTGYDVVWDTVKAGSGYQWPRCYGYSHEMPTNIGGGCGGQVEPAWSSEATTTVPTGAEFVDSAGPAGMAGKLVFCNYNGGMLILTPGAPHATVAKGPAECQLDVVQGPDRAVYYSDTEHIYRRS
jgi:glucose/arabinose dehydrogenase